VEQILKNFTLDFFGKGKHKVLPEDFFKTNDGFLLDVRSEEEASAVSIKMKHLSNVECKNIPIDQLPDRIQEIPTNKSIAIFCPANVRSTMAYIYLRSKGCPDVRIMEGGYVALTNAVKPGKILQNIVHGDTSGAGK
jgi:rhodanese-related sulfurtransferase